MAAAGSERGPIGGGREFDGVPLCVTSQPVSDAPLLHNHASKIIILLLQVVITVVSLYHACSSLIGLSAFTDHETTNSNKHRLSALRLVCELYIHPVLQAAGMH